MEFENTVMKLNQDIPWKIYVSRALSAWDDRLWFFGAGIFMVALDPDNLRLVASYGLVLSISVIIFGEHIGKWIDQSHRLKAAKTFLLIQNLSTAFNCMLLAFYFAKVEEEYWPTWLPTVTAIVTIILADVAQIGSIGSRIILEKDWIVVVSRKDDDRLAKINSVFTSIDLTAFLVGPLTAGLVFDFVSYWGAAVFIAVLNLVSLIFQYLLLASIYNDFPDLAHKKIFQNKQQNGDLVKKSNRAPILHGWKLYMTSPIRNAGIALAALYMTVLGFDNITYGFCIQLCVSESLLGGLVGVSSLVGIISSILFPLMRKCMGLAETGIFGFFALNICNSLCVASIFLNGSPFYEKYYENAVNNQTPALNQTSNDIEITDLDNCVTSSYFSVGLLLAGIISARFGLWISDLTVTQILQEKVIEEHRGIIGGVQNSMNSVMDTIKFVAVIFFPDKETFGWLVIASFISVFLGAVFYTYYAIFQDLHKKHEKNISQELVIDSPNKKFEARSTTKKDVTEEEREYIALLDDCDA